MATRPISPAEPPRKRPPFIQPNAHPYAIKTTSSALLSRSNSSPHSAHHTRHHYIPPPPSRIPIGTKVRHHHSSSLSSVEGEVHNVNGALKQADKPILPPARRRAETMPSSATESVTEDHEFSHSQDVRSRLCAGLPSNPKQWNTDQLTTYLETFFKSGNIGDDESGIAGILECVRTRGLTGRELLRLTDEDLTGIPLSGIQRIRLLERSRTLRADVLRGRISVDSYHSREVSDNSINIYSQCGPATFFDSIRGASASVDDLRLLVDNDAGEGESALPPSPIMSLHRSNSVSDATAQRYRDLAHMRMRRRGKVKGLVETWERASTSGSECSGSEVESESETDPEFASISGTEDFLEPPSNLPTDEPTQTPSASVVDAALLPHEPPLSTPPPPYIHMHNGLETTRIEEEEPSIEELLASSPNIPLTGARAWEVDSGLGETVKRVPASANADAESASQLVTEPVAFRRSKDDSQRTKSGSVSSKGSGRWRSTGSRGKNAKSRKRVVTAIFAGSPFPPDDVLEDAGDEVQLRGRQHHRSSSIVCGRDSQNDHDVLRTLEASIAVTRAQLETFRLRLEKVEADTARQEAMLMRAHCSDSFHPSEFELRRRRSEASEQVHVDIVQRPGDEVHAKDAKNRETTSLTHAARTIVAKTIGWLFPYGHLGVHVPEDHDQQTCSSSHPGENVEYRSPAKRSDRLRVARMSCSVILVSFAICAAVLRRMGFGRWVRKP